jgi:hypothetical protein
MIISAKVEKNASVKRTLKALWLEACSMKAPIRFGALPE